MSAETSGIKFPPLTAEDIEVKVKKVTNNGAIALLYKTARTDMNMLDAIVGPMNWKCSYRDIKGNLYCEISIYDPEKKEWISKEDCGIESREDDEGNQRKGEASDAFKRAGFKWGIGRELYTAPFIFIQCATKQKNNGKGYELANPFERFSVKSIGYDNTGKINALIIVDSKGKTVYKMGQESSNPPLSKEDRTAKLKVIKMLIRKLNLEEKFKGKDLTALTDTQINDTLIWLNRKMNANANKV